MSEVLSLDEGDLAERAGQAARALDDGRLVVVPADTMYAVLTNPFHPHGTDRVFAARGGSRVAPLPVVVHNRRQLPAFAEVGEEAERLITAYWPGPLTLLMEQIPSMAWDLGAPGSVVAVRMPAEPILLEILASTGPLACTAASVAGTPPPTTAAEAVLALGDEVAFYLDGGPRTGTPSTVVDVSRGGAEVRRAGPISADDVFTVANAVDGDPPTPTPPPPPPT